MTQQVRALDTNLGHLNSVLGLYPEKGENQCPWVAFCHLSYVLYTSHNVLIFK